MGIEYLPIGQNVPKLSNTACAKLHCIAIVITHASTVPIANAANLMVS